MMRFPQRPYHPPSYGDSGPIDVDAKGDVCSSVFRPVIRDLSRAAVLFLAALPSHLAAQVRAPVDGGRTRSLGQPYAWNWTVGASTAALNTSAPDGLNGQVRLGSWVSIGNPVIQAITFGFEGYAGDFKGRLDGGIRARLALPIFRVAGGLDLDARTGSIVPIYSFVHPGRRGGLFRDGSMARLDYMPARGGSVTLGIEVPLRRDVPTGRTRPARDHVRLTGPRRTPAPSLVPPTPALSMATTELADAAKMIGLLSVPFLGRDLPGGPARAVPRSLAQLRDRLLAPESTSVAGPVRTTETEARRFHAAVERALAAVLDSPNDGAGAPRAPAFAASYRRIVLHEVLLPYDRLLGRVRSPDSIDRFAFRAQGVFLRWLHAEGGSTGSEALRAMTVFTTILDVLEAERAAIARSWGDSRFVWLPLQYALRPEDHDTQAEIDAIVAQAAEQQFTDGNFVSYVINEQFQAQLGRTIRAARDYHVLVTHDFRGLDDEGHPDTVAFDQVVHAYLEALTARVREYDSTGTFPTYLILQDEFYYSLRGAPLFLELLEDPTRHQVRLPSAQRAWQDTIEAAQQRLRDAIAKSSLLQQQRRQYGEPWLRGLIKVHVNITNRPDPTFWSWTLVPGLPIQDNMLRDHRKLVFYDVDAEDPYHGEAIYTGAGVGEHYTNGLWEDRALVVTGPAVLGLKEAIRQLLLDHGFRDDRIPFPLRSRPLGAGYVARNNAVVERSEWPLRAMGVHNGSGFLPKRVNVAKAVIYTLMPPGSVITVPDSFWNSEFWGAALFGASLRGVRVLLIAPSYASNSVQVSGTQLLSRELLSRMLAARTAFTPQITATGGLLGLGIFDSEIPVNEIAGKVGAVRQTFEREAWLRELFKFPDKVYADLARLEGLAAKIRVPTYGEPPKPGTRTRIHIKSNLFASREAWTMMTLPTWSDMSLSFVMARSAQVTATRDAPDIASRDAMMTSIIDVGRGEMSTWYERLDPAVRERVVFYAVMGSQNQNSRSMVMDAEDALVVSHWPSVIPWLDAIALIGQSHWVTSQPEIDRFLPPMGRFRTLMAHWGRLAF